jgi:hypothetical protein
MTMTIEERREYQRNRYRHGKEGVKVYDGRSHPENVEYHRELKRKYYESHKEEIKERRELKKNGVITEKPEPVECACGITLKRGNLDEHKATAMHERRMYKKAIADKLKEERQALYQKFEAKKSYYRCDRGIHKGKLLCDVVLFHPEYIDFLIKHHRETFPEPFLNALIDCGVDVNKYEKQNCGTSTECLDKTT